MRYLLIVVLAAALGGAAWWLSRPKPVEVLLHTVERGVVRATVSNTRVGTVEACRRARMSPSAAGQVAQLPVKEGDKVQAGQVLLEIWNDDLVARQRHVDAEIVAAGRRVEEACAQADGARREAERLRKMGRQRLVSEDALDAAETKAAATRAACGAARAAVGVSQESRQVVAEEIERTRLRAPFPGVVAEINAKLGEFITPSPTGIPTLPAVDLIDMSCLYVSAPIDEVDAPQIAVGMPACVSLDAFDDKRCGAVVRRIAPYVLDREKQARTVEVEVEFTQAEQLKGLLPGYSADIEVLVDEHPDVVRVPTEAVVKDRHVYVLEDGVLKLREFERGLANWEYTEAKSGLEPGTRIVLSVGREGVKEGVAAVEDDGVDE
ncbi:MAG: efflux RND transporter periplasmic adaptor subunit [Gammaproteobacteria bacterium]